MLYTLYINIFLIFQRELCEKFKVFSALYFRITLKVIRVALRWNLKDIFIICTSCVCDRQKHTNKQTNKTHIFWSLRTRIAFLFQFQLTSTYKQIALMFYPRSLYSYQTVKSFNFRFLAYFAMFLLTAACFSRVKGY